MKRASEEAFPARPDAKYVPRRSAPGREYGRQGGSGCGLDDGLCGGLLWRKPGCLRPAPGGGAPGGQNTPDEPIGYMHQSETATGEYADTSAMTVPNAVIGAVLGGIAPLSWRMRGLAGTPQRAGHCPLDLFPHPQGTSAPSHCVVAATQDPAAGHLQDSGGHVRAHPSPGRARLAAGPGRLAGLRQVQEDAQVGDAGRVVAV